MRTDYHGVFREFLVETLRGRTGAIEVEVKGLCGCDEIDCKKQSSDSCGRRCERSMAAVDEIEDGGGHASFKAEVEKNRDRGLGFRCGSAGQLHHQTSSPFLQSTQRAGFPVFVTASHCSS